MPAVHQAVVAGVRGQPGQFSLCDQGKPDAVYFIGRLYRERRGATIELYRMEVQMPTRRVKRPAFSAMSERECEDLLQRNHVGRLCFINNGQADVEPVHYVRGDGWIFLRSAMGTKIEAFAHHPYVAFEIDEIRDTFAWRSVVARGTIYVLPPDGPRVEKEALKRAVAALRSFVPESLTDDDPTPARQIVYGIHVDRLTGRMAEPDEASSTRPRLRTPSLRARAPRTRNGF